MKACLQCGQENENVAAFCRACNYEEFAPSGPEFLTTEVEGRLTILKCRTPGEAFLVAEALEAAEILAIVADEKSIWVEFEEKGFVSIQVSTRSYQAAKELLTVIERRHWIERAQASLPVLMIATAVTLGIFWCPGFAFFFMVNNAYKTKGYQRKSKSFVRWFCLGFALCFVFVGAISNWIEGRHPSKP